MKETIINIYPITQFILILFAIVGGYNLLNNVAHLLARCSKDKLDNKKDIHAKNCDSDIMQDLIAKFPLVSPEFMQKTIKEQNIENNQEIHQINKALISLQKDINEIRRIQNGGL
jgi:hypothetical protein